MRTTTPKLDRVPDVHNDLGETPVWSPAEAALYWTNVEPSPELLRWDSVSGAVRRWPMPERLGGFALKQGGGALVVLASGLFDFDFATAKLSLRVASPFSSNVALHECQVDPSGRFWVGSIDKSMGPGNMTPGGGSFFRLDGAKLTPVITGISCANGLAFSPDGRYLYIADSPSAGTDRYDIDARTGAISNRIRFCQFAPGEGYPDGAATDAEGGYWVTIVTKKQLRRYLPDGTLDIVVELPFENPTKVAFGGPDLRTLYITSAAENFSGHPISPLNGGLFSFTPGMAGWPDPLVAG